MEPRFVGTAPQYVRSRKDSQEVAKTRSDINKILFSLSTRCTTLVPGVK